MRILSLAALAFLLLPWSERPARSEGETPEQTQLTVDEASYDEKTGVFYAAGRCGLPDDTQICATVVFAGNAGELVRGPAKEGKYRLEFPSVGEKWVLAGSYKVQVEIRPEDQGPEMQIPQGLIAFKEIQIGSPEKQAEEIAKIKDQILEFTENCRALFLRAEEKGSYILLGIDRKKKAGKLTETDKSNYLDAWSTFAGPDRFWLTTYNQVHMGYDDYVNGVYMSYFPTVETDFRAVLETLLKWFYSYWHDICMAVEREIPKDIQERGQFFDRASVEGGLAKSVNNIYAALQTQAINWHPVNLYDSEDGQIVKNTYTSKTTTFEISRPNDQWTFKIEDEDPVLRLRIEPHDPIRAARGHVEVRVNDFPDSSGPKDLVDLVEMMAHDTFPSYKKVSGKSISVSDDNFPGGSRPGYDLVFQYESNTVKYKCRSYELFCGTWKRTYAVLCIAYQDAWGEYEADFESMCKSFKVLKQALPEGDSEKK